MVLRQILMTGSPVLLQQAAGEVVATPLKVDSVRQDIAHLGPSLSQIPISFAKPSVNSGYLESEAPAFDLLQQNEDMIFIFSPTGRLSPESRPLPGTIRF